MTLALPRTAQPALDADRMAQALGMAERAVGVSEPNPRVGCVIGRADGTLLGLGHTQQAGSAHAEVMALRDAQAKGSEVRGATAWVTLEPCAHHGRTPPCCDALIDAGIQRVVVATLDPFVAVNGRGVERLRAHGIQVDVVDGQWAQASRELNIGFFSRHERGRPWVRVKVAQSLDGRSALADGTSQWITSPSARADGHLWRRRAGAILTGIGTVLHDNPRLDVRDHATMCQPLRVVLDSRWRTPVSSRLLDPPGRALIFGVGAAIPMGLQSACDTQRVEPSADSGVKLSDVLRELARREVNELHVEAGARLNAALHAGAWVDEWLLYVAPRWLGPGRPALHLPASTAIPEGLDGHIVDHTLVGPDLRIRVRPNASAPVSRVSPGLTVDLHQTDQSILS